MLPSLRRFDTVCHKVLARVLARNPQIWMDEKGAGLQSLMEFQRVQAAFEVVGALARKIWFCSLPDNAKANLMSQWLMAEEWASMSWFDGADESKVGPAVSK